MGFGDCEVCREKYGELVSTVGGYSVKMCTRCRNDFHEFCMENGIIEGYVAMKADQEVRAAIHDHTAVDMTKKVYKLRYKVYYIVKAWIEKRKEHFNPPNEEER